MLIREKIPDRDRANRCSRDLIPCSGSWGIARVKHCEIRPKIGKYAVLFAVRREMERSSSVLLRLGGRRHETAALGSGQL